MRRKAVLAAVAITLSFGVGLGIAELAARFALGPDFGRKVRMSEHAVEGRKNFVISTSIGSRTYDQDGFRNTAPTVPHDREILFVGDSFTDGDGVGDEQSFAAVAQQKLVEAGLRVRALNAGAVGLGTSQELRLLRAQLQRRSFDAIVFQLFPANDLDDNFEDGGFSVEQGRLVEHNPPRTSPWDHWLDNEWLGSSVLVRAIVARIEEPKRVAARAQALELERLLLGEVVRLAEAHHVPLLFAVVSFSSECDRLSRKDAWTVTEADPGVRQILKDLSPNYLDLCRVAARSENFGQVNRHYSPLGNERVGAALAERLVPMLEVAKPTVIQPLPRGGNSSLR